MCQIRIREERPEDYGQIETLVRLAFAPVPESSHDEEDLVRRLRASAHFLPRLCLVAERAGRLIGHVMLSLGEIRDSRSRRRVPTLVLAPLCVHPDAQRQGTGSLLVHRVHELARAHGHRSCMVLGNPDYYGRFGYRPAGDFGIRFPLDVPQRFCLGAELVPGALRDTCGTLVYDTAFGIEDAEEDVEGLA